MRKRIWALFTAVVLALSWVAPGVAQAAESGAPVAATLLQSAQEGADWLRTHQHAGGDWGELPRLAVRDTGSALAALHAASVGGAPVETGTAWLASAPAAEHDSLARALTGLGSAPDLAARLAQGQNSDGGWGLAPGYTSDPLDTALALQALAGAGSPFLEAAQRGADFLAAGQGADGSWAVQPGGAGSLSITAQAVSALGAARLAGARVSTDVLRSGAAWLVAHQNWDGSWGTFDRAALTALAYRGALQGAAVSRIGPAPEWLVDHQAADGSWEGRAYPTAEAVQTLALAARIPSARLGPTQLMKPGPGGAVPATSFQAYQAVILQADAPPAGLALEAVVAGLPGGAFQPGDDGSLVWKTGATPPGAYAAVVLLKETATGLVLDERTLDFTIESTVGLRSLDVFVSPDRARVGESLSPQVVAQVGNGSNLPGSVALTARVAQSDGTVVQETSVTVALTPGDDPTIPPILSFVPDTNAPREYQVTVLASTGEQAATLFRVLPPPAPVRIEPSKSVSPQQVLPGEADVAININLEGKGSAEQPGRQPIDLVLTVDNSGSMDWGDIPWVTGHPSRSEAARAAGKALVDLLGPTDRGALVTFSYTFWTYLRQGLTTDRTLLKNRIDQYVYPNGATAIGAGLQKAREHLQGNSPVANKRVIVLLSDGEETEWSRAQVVAQANLAAQQGILIYTIGLGGTADRALLQDLATATGGKFYFSPAVQDLQAIMDELGRSLLQSAGKDVRVVDTIPAAGAEIVAGSISPAPYSVTRSGDNWAVEWRFPEIAIGKSQPLALSLHLTDLQPNQVREVNHRLVLTYTDDQSRTVTEELGPYNVNVAGAQVAGTIAADKAEYGPDEPVLITAEVTNLGSAPRTPEAVIEVLDGAGAVLTTALTQTVSLPGGGSQTLTAQWNTGTHFAGHYFVRLRLLDGGRLAGTDQAEFIIRADGGASLQTRTDKAVYNPGEPVQIASRIRSESRNAVLTDLNLLTTVTAPDGTTVLSREQPVAELVPGARADLALTWAETAAAPAGPYTVHAVLLQGQTPLDDQTVPFAITSSGETGAGLTGSLTASPRMSLPSGDASFAYTVRNGGNGTVSGTLTLIMADPGTGAALAALEAPLDLAAGGVLEGQFDYRFDDLPVGPLLASFGAVLPNGTRVPLGTTGLTTVRPFDLTASLDGNLRRVLVWSGPGEALDRITAGLDARGVWHTIVGDAVAFQRELRSGAYGAVILANGSGAAATAADGLDHLDWELREKVYGGTGLILLGPAVLPQLADEQHRPGTWLGAEAGTLPDSGYSATFGEGRILWMEYAPATLEQTLDAALPAVVRPLAGPDSGGVVALSFQVTAGPLPVTAQVQVVLPDGAAIVADLAPHEQKRYTILVRLPVGIGDHPIQLRGAYLAHGEYHPSATAEVMAAGLPDLPTLIEAVRAALPTARDKAEANLIRNLTRTLDDLRQHPPQTAPELDQAIHRLLQDLNRLQSLRGDTQATHAAYVRLLGSYQARWAMGR